MELGIKQEKKYVTIDKYLQSGIYMVLRKCPMAYSAFGHDSIWDMSVLEFKWLVENLAEEFKPPKNNKKKGKK